MPHLSAKLLGPLQIALDGAAAPAFESDKVRALLIYLLVEGDRPHRRGALAELLWPDRPERAALLNLNQALANLRRAIGDRDAVVPLLLVSRESIQLNPAASCSLDLAELAGLLATCERHSHPGPSACAQCARRYERVSALYRGAFLEQFAPRDSLAFQEWALVLRERLHRQVIQAVEHLVAYHERRGEIPAALQVAYRQAELDPWSEDAHRRVMRLLARDGQRAAALAQYEKCRALLEAELGVEPDDETTELYEQIKSDPMTGWQDDPMTKNIHRPVIGSSCQNLTSQLTPFVGREQELQRLAALLNDPGCRLVTIVGLGGSGKTRLAIQAALEQRDSFADGTCAVMLAAVESGALVAPAVAHALGLALSGPEDPLAQVVTHLRERQLLLVLDNLEHLRAPIGAQGAGPVVTAILDQAPGVTILATSRERLGLRGEWAIDLAGLETPAGPHDVETSGAGQLFLQAARRATADFVAGSPERESIVRICRGLAGHPLAIELAAAWANVLSCDEIAAEIAQDLDLLATRFQDTPERQRSLRAVLEATWRLLADEERQVVRRLALFRGGFDREAAAQVAGASLARLAGLAGKALLARSAAGRYDLHPLVRQFARDQLDAAGETAATWRSLLAWLVALAEQAEPHFKGADEEAWLDRLDAEHDNLRAALGWALEHGEVEAAGRICAVLRWFWYIRGHIAEGRQWIERELAAARQLPLAPRLRARLLQGAGVLGSDQGDYQRGAAYFAQALALYREQADDVGVQATVHSLGMLASEQGDYERAQAHFEESLAACRRLGHSWGVANRLNSLGLVAYAQGRSDRALACYAEALAIARTLDNAALTAMVLSNIGEAALAQGDLGRAEGVYAEALRRQRAIDDRRSAALSLHGLAMVALRRGDLDLAARQLHEGLAMSWDSANRRDLAAYMQGVATLLSAQGRLVETATLCAAIEVFRELHRTPFSAAERPLHEQVVDLARNGLPAESFAAAWAAGRATSLERLIAGTLRIPAGRRAASGSPAQSPRW